MNSREGPNGHWVGTHPHSKGTQRIAWAKAAARPDERRTRSGPRPRTPLTRRTLGASGSGASAFWRLVVPRPCKKASLPKHHSKYAFAIGRYYLSLLRLVWPLGTALSFLFPWVYLQTKQEIKKYLNGSLLSKLFWSTVIKNVLLIEKNFWNSRLKAENLQNFWDHYNNFFQTVKGQNNFW